MSLKLQSLDLFYPIYSTRGFFKFFASPPGIPSGRRTVLVRMTAEDGSQGWGQCVPSPRWSYETVETVASTIQGYLAPALLGIDLEEEQEFQSVLHREVAPSFSTGQPICKAGLDLARWDLLGNKKKLSAMRLVAGEESRDVQDRIELSWTLNVQKLTEIESEMALACEAGYRHFNIKLGPDPGFDVEFCKLVRRIAPNSFLWGDANGGYSFEAARGVAPKLADLGMQVLEQPLPANNISGYRRLKRQGALPIFLDEGILSLSDLEQFAELEMMDGVTMKVARVGGLSESWRMIKRIEELGFDWLGSGLTDPDLSLAASLQLFGYGGLKKPAALNAPQYLTDSVLKKPFETREGFLTIPGGSGLGGEVDMDKLFALNHLGKVRQAE